VAASGRSAVATVSVKQFGGTGKVLVDARGRPLYANDQEHGKVLCTAGCLSLWQPLKVTGQPHGSGLPAKLAVVKRPDGGRQVTFEGRLLYTFTLDKPGKVTGNGFKDSFGGHKFTWHAAHPTKSVTSSNTTSTTPTYP
jgi:predicted lipoprotein with Yx(FWY)xxD motif